MFGRTCFHDILSTVYALVPNRARKCPSDVWDLRSRGDPPDERLLDPPSTYNASYTMRNI